MGMKINSSLVDVPETKRIKCLYTSHEMPYNAGVVKAYLSCSKFKRACVERLFDNEYLVDVSSQPKHLNQVFCKLTWRYINKDADHIRKHMNGKQFQRALAAYKEAKSNNEEFVPFSGKYQMKYF